MTNPRVDAWIDALEGDLQQVAMACRDAILRLVPGVEERYSFSIPFYHYFGMFCYINLTRHQAIELCFLRGKDLVMAYPQLQLAGRVMVAGLLMRNMKDFKTLEAESVIAGAAMWNEEAKRLKKSPLNTRPGKKKKGKGK